MNIKLVKLTEEYKKQLTDMMEEWLSVEQDFSPYVIRKNDYKNFEYYLEHLETDEENAKLDGLVPDSTYFCLDMDRDIFVGAINIRHYLNEYLCHSGGHIGDGIRPSERRKGYATAMIGLALDKCREMGMHKVLMTCDRDNIGSAKSIMNNGGVMDYEILEDGVPEQRYWITLQEEIIESNHLILKRRMPSDAEEILAWDTDSKTANRVADGTIGDLNDLRLEYEKNDPNSSEHYIMISRSKEDNHAVGFIVCDRKTEREGYEISCRLRPDDMDKGYCDEMIQAMTEYLNHRMEKEV